MKVFSSSENQLLNIHQHTIDTFITQNNFVEEKKNSHTNKSKAKQIEKKFSYFHR